MHFRIEQFFDAAPEVVCEALYDVSYLAAMGELPDLSAATQQSLECGTDVVSQALEFQFRGKLPSAVTRVIDARRLTWLQHDEIDLRTSRCRFRLVPIHYQRFFTCSGTWVLTPDPAGSRRVIEGQLKVNSPVPFVGGTVEKAIVTGLKERLADEPAVFARWHAGRTAR